MKRFLSLSVVALLSLSLFAACSSGSSGPSCEDVCNKMVECDPTENYTECISNCDEYSEFMRDEVYETMGDCFMEQTCVFLEENGDYCFAAAMAQGSMPAAQALVERMCVKITTECAPEGSYTQEACVADLSEDDGETDDPNMVEIMSMFKDSVLDCVGKCFEETDCAELQDDGAFGCMIDCGLGFLVEDDLAGSNSSSNVPDA